MTSKEDDLKDELTVSDHDNHLSDFETRADDQATEIRTRLDASESRVAGKEKAQVLQAAKDAALIAGYAADAAATASSNTEDIKSTIGLLAESVMETAQANNEVIKVLREQNRFGRWLLAFLILGALMLVLLIPIGLSIRSNSATNESTLSILKGRGDPTSLYYAPIKVIEACIENHGDIARANLFHLPAPPFMSGCVVVDGIK